MSDLATKAAAGEALSIQELADLYVHSRLIDFIELARGPILNGQSVEDTKAAALAMSDGVALRRVALRRYTRVPE